MVLFFRYKNRVWLAKEAGFYRVIFSLDFLLYLTDIARGTLTRDTWITQHVVITIGYHVEHSTRDHLTLAIIWNTQHVINHNCHR